MKLSPTEIYNDRRIFLIGSTGFLGKVTLSMLLHRFPNVGRVYVTVRARSQEESHTRFWNNVITACSSCNTRKGNSLPEECGMMPLRHPFEPHFVHLSWAVRKLTPVQTKYIRLFYGAEVLAELRALQPAAPRVAHGH